MSTLAIPEWLTEPLFWILALGAAAVVAGLYALTVLGQRKRLRQLAEKWGLAFDPEAEGVERFGGVLRAEIGEQMRGEGHRFRNLLSGVVEDFECAYVEYSQPPSLKRRLQEDPAFWESWSVVWVRFPGRNFPRFTLYPREDVTFTHGVRGESLYLELKDNPNFETYFLVEATHTQQRERLKQLFSRAVQDFFVAERERGWRVEGAGEWLGCYRRCVGSAYAELLFEQARQLRELFARATG
jgi:hypothetical protein